LDTVMAGVRVSETLLAGVVVLVVELAVVALAAREGDWELRCGLLGW